MTEAGPDVVGKWLAVEKNMIRMTLDFTTGYVLFLNSLDKAFERETAFLKTLEKNKAGELNMNLMEQQTAERITEIIRKITGYSDRIVWEENLSTYGMNSMKTMELVIALEIEFNIQFEDEELVLGRFSSARNIMEQLKLKLQREA